MLQMTVLNSSYVRAENSKLDYNMERLYQKSLPTCLNDMFGTFLLDADPARLAKYTPPNHITFHLRVPILTLAATQYSANADVFAKYRLPDLGWHMNSSNPSYRAHVQYWITWVMQSDANYVWMRSVFEHMIAELKRMKSYTADSAGVVSCVDNMIQREPVVSLHKSEELTKFPSNVRISRARLVAHRWMYAQYKKSPEWWPYPNGTFSQEYVDMIDKAKRKILENGFALVLDQVPDMCFTPPPMEIAQAKHWEQYNWKKFKRYLGNWHKVYEYDHNWLQRWIV